MRPAVPHRVTPVVILRWDSSDQFTDSCAVAPEPNSSVEETVSSTSAEKMLSSRLPDARATGPRYQVSRSTGCAA